MNRSLTIIAAATLAAGGCSVAGNAGTGGATTVVVGYQSKTINTVTAGTLLRSLGYFEKALGTKYKVVWQDYDTGAPITAQMLAGKIDIGSMGDYPLLINGSRAQAQGADARTELVSVTGYNLRGSLNGVVVDKNAKFRTIADLKGKTVSASIGSAGHGTLVQALKKYAVGDVKTENQQPSVGASALQSGKAAALAQFVAWPGLLVNRGQARLLYDGGDLDVPTFHGVVVRSSFAEQRGDVLQAFLKAQIQATDYLHAHPVEAAESVARSTGLPAETVYLYNGAGGQSTFDVTLKKQLGDALRHDVPFLKQIGVLQNPVNLDKFIDDQYIRRAYGAKYDQDAAATQNKAAIKGTDEACKKPVDDPAKAGEIWLDGEHATHPAADPQCLLKNVKTFRQNGRKIRAVYAQDALTGTRWFADAMVWLHDGGRYLPFATRQNADRYRAAHPNATDITYEEAVRTA
ncbi:ABC transporter substrate-binding protein [Actinomadura rayongensis]|uniref:ABC transporter substrate-binding protein n=1 Tax=Actinomadura rayongensis TaxID=1429076 RepID=A0A6I4WDU8_9ACTN|nr:ABC transporter substrate-binding protein [Actinomadura rayongensis]